jgi:hypothetical protein
MFPQQVLGKAGRLVNFFYGSGHGQSLKGIVAKDDYGVHQRLDFALAAVKCGIGNFEEPGRDCGVGRNCPGDFRGIGPAALDELNNFCGNHRHGREIPGGHDGFLEILVQMAQLLRNAANFR